MNQLEEETYFFLYFITEKYIYKNIANTLINNRLETHYFVATVIRRGAPITERVL